MTTTIQAVAVDLTKEGPTCHAVWCDADAENPGGVIATIGFIDVQFCADHATPDYEEAAYQAVVDSLSKPVQAVVRGLDDTLDEIGVLRSLVQMEKAAGEITEESADAALSDLAQYRADVTRMRDVIVWDATRADRS